MNDPVPKGNPLSIPLPPHQSLNYESSEASSIAAVSQSLTADPQTLPGGQQTFNGDPLCNICEETLEPMFAQTCGLCKLHYHLQCGDNVVITTNYYFELCRACAEKCNRAKTKWYNDLLAAGETWNEELWLHSLARTLRQGNALQRHPNKHLHKLNKYVWTLIRDGQPLERLYPSGRQDPLILRDVVSSRGSPVQGHVVPESDP